LGAVEGEGTGRIAKHSDDTLGFSSDIKSVGGRWKKEGGRDGDGETGGRCFQFLIDDLRLLVLVLKASVFELSLEERV